MRPYYKWGNTEDGYVILVYMCVITKTRLHFEHCIIMSQTLNMHTPHCLTWISAHLYKVAYVNDTPLKWHEYKDTEIIQMTHTLATEWKKNKTMNGHSWIRHVNTYFRGSLLVLWVCDMGRMYSVIRLLTRLFPLFPCLMHSVMCLLTVFHTLLSVCKMGNDEGTGSSALFPWH